MNGFYVFSFFFFFLLLPLLPPSHPISSFQTPTLSFTTSLNRLFGLPLSLLPGSSIFSILCLHFLLSPCCQTPLLLLCLQQTLTQFPPAPCWQQQQRRLLLAQSTTDLVWKSHSSRSIFDLAKAFTLHVLPDATLPIYWREALGVDWRVPLPPVAELSTLSSYC